VTYTDPTVLYGGVYRAVCLEVLVDRIRVQVPQLYAGETVTIYECAGPRPDTGDQGWVAFEAQRPERPVWLGAESKGVSGGTAPVNGVPPDGAAGAVLTKASAADYDMAWEPPPTPLATTFRYVQATPQAIWTVTHNLGFYPNVSVVDSSGREVVGEINYIDVNTVQLTFSGAFGGEAYFS